MATISPEEIEWNKQARAENNKCPACGEFIKFADREIFSDRNLCRYCAEMIPKRN
jgi:formylmethanofuran dehydrogenase subunit E